MADLPLTMPTIQLEPNIQQQALLSTFLVTSASAFTNMKAMVIKKYGPDASFEMVDTDKPVAKPGELLVKIAASSVNTVDSMIRTMGKDLPLSPDEPALLGMDFAGTVEQVGEDVQGFAVGDEVYGCAGGLANLPGTLAEYIAADAKLVAKKPKNLSMKQAAALPLVGITAYEGLVRCNIAKDKTVLVHGGTGGVGSMVVQMAKAAGARVFATCGTDEKVQLALQELGADRAN